MTTGAKKGKSNLGIISRPKHCGFVFSASFSEWFILLLSIWKIIQWLFATFYIMCMLNKEVTMKNIIKLTVTANATLSHYIQKCIVHIGLHLIIWIWFLHAHLLLNLLARWTFYHSATLNLWVIEWTDMSPRPSGSCAPPLSARCVSGSNAMFFSSRENWPLYITK